MRNVFLTEEMLEGTIAVLVPKKENSPALWRIPCAAFMTIDIIFNEDKSISVSLMIDKRLLVRNESLSPREAKLTIDRYYKAIQSKDFIYTNIPQLISFDVHVIKQGALDQYTGILQLIAKDEEHARELALEWSRSIDYLSIDEIHPTELLTPRIIKYPKF